MARQAGQEPLTDFFEIERAAARTGIIDRRTRAEGEIDETAKSQVFFTALNATDIAERVSAIRRLTGIYAEWQDDNDLTRLTIALAHLADGNVAQLDGLAPRILHGYLNDAGKVGDLTIPELTSLVVEQMDAMKGGTICLYFPSHGTHGLL